MLFSLITTTFNSAQTIAATMCSVKKQSWGNIEHIIIDGASTDGTLEVLDRHKDQIMTLISEPDQGLYDAMNKGLRMARGDVIGFLNSDDIYAHENVVSQIMGTFARDTIDAVTGDVGFFSPGAPHKVTRRYRSDHFTPERLAWGVMPAHPALFMKKSVYQETGMFDPSFQLSGDYDYIVRVFWGKSRSIHYIPEILVKMQSGGISAPSLTNTILLNREVLRACKQNGVPTNILKILSKYPRKLMELSLTI